MYSSWLIVFGQFRSLLITPSSREAAEAGKQQISRSSGRDCGANPALVPSPTLGTLSRSLSLSVPQFPPLQQGFIAPGGCPPDLTPSQQRQGMNGKGRVPSQGAACTHEGRQQQGGPEQGLSGVRQIWVWVLALCDRGQAALPSDLQFQHLENKDN